MSPKCTGELSKECIRLVVWLGARVVAAPDVFVLKVAASAPPDDPGPQALQLFVDRVNEASGGRIDVRLYAGSALGEDRRHLGVPSLNRRRK